MRHAVSMSCACLKARMPEIQTSSRSQALAACWRFQAVSHAAHGGNSHATRFHLLSEPVDVDLDRVGADLLAPSTQVSDELFLGHELSRALEEEFEEREFARGQIEPLTVELGDAPDEI